MLGSTKLPRVAIANAQKSATLHIVNLRIELGFFTFLNVFTSGQIQPLELPVQNGFSNVISSLS